ncbi:MAG: hypothetical protein SFY80_06055 [Verrucomicrobiota bacterium]|nr:hypothetical protein [Verrucomicrobiota bacterium]
MSSTQAFMPSLEAIMSATRTIMRIDQSSMPMNWALKPIPQAILSVIGECLINYLGEMADSRADSKENGPCLLLCISTLILQQTDYYD